MPLKVYYLDDEIDLTEIFSECLNIENVVIKTFNQPKEIIQAVENDPPDIIFLDYLLPNTTGDKIAELLPKHIAKALVTGNLQVNLSVNFDGVFFKPFDFDAIEKFIKGHLKN